MMRLPQTLFLTFCLGFAVICASCVNYKKTQKVDKRSYGQDSPDQDANPEEIPPASDGIDPVPTIPAVTAPPTVAPVPFLLQDGLWQIERVTCSDSSTETLDSIWTYTQKSGSALFTKKSTGGCQHLQEGKVIVSDRKLALTPGNTRCEGVCSSGCKPLVLAGTEILIATEQVQGGTVLKSGLPLILDFCSGKQPAAIFMSPRRVDACQVKWTTIFGSGSLQVFDGVLHWNIPAIRKLQTHTLIHSQELQGDFTIEIAYKGLEAVGRGAYFKAAIIDIDDPRYQAFVMAGNYSTAKGEADIHLAAVVTDGNFIDPPNSATGTRSQADGMLTIEKRGTRVKTSSVSIGDPSIEKTNPDDKPFTNGRYQVILSLGSNSNLADINEVTSVNIDLVSITDGTGSALAASDPFDCPSIK